MTRVQTCALPIYLASARLGTENILGRPFEVTESTKGPLMLEVSRTGGKIQGTVIDDHDMPVAGAQVILVPPIDFREDQTAYKNAIADGRGRFKLAGIRPGHYTAYSVRQRVDLRAWMNPEFLTPYLASGEPLDVLAEQSVERNLKVIVP